MSFGYDRQTPSAAGRESVALQDPLNETEDDEKIVPSQEVSSLLEMTSYIHIPEVKDTFSKILHLSSGRKMINDKKLLSLLVIRPFFICLHYSIRHNVVSQHNTRD